MNNAKNVMQVCRENKMIRNCEKSGAMLYGISKHESDSDYEKKDRMQTTAEQKRDKLEEAQASANSSSSSDEESRLR